MSDQTRKPTRMNSRSTPARSAQPVEPPTGSTPTPPITGLARAEQAARAICFDRKPLPFRDIEFVYDGLYCALYDESPIAQAVGDQFKQRGYRLSIIEHDPEQGVMRLWFREV